MLDERVLLERWRGGDAAAGEKLVREYYREIFKRLRRDVNGDSDLAADLAQQVFEVALKKRDDIVTDFRRYLHGIARRKVWEHARIQIGRGLESKISKLVDPARGAVSVLAKAEDGSALVAALRTLSVEEQSYLMWYYADRLTQGQIAERVGLSTPQVNGRIHRAKEKLRRKWRALDQGTSEVMTEEGFESYLHSLRRRVEPSQLAG
ncbi:MAG: sigma-70 family RNA polymerase sigma factor [Myxococcota bacterium]